MKTFFVLWASQTASMFGSSVVGFALAWYMTRETGSATILATVMMVNFLPTVILGPFIGPFIDRWNRKKIMIYGDFVTMLLTLILVMLFYTDTIQIWHVYVLTASRAVSGSFQGPALGASISMIVPKKHLVRANAFNRSRDGAINIVGPPAGALLIEAFPMQWVFSMDIITAVIAIVFLLPLSIPQPVRNTLSDKMNVTKDMVQGFRYVAAWKGLLYLLILIALMNYFAAPTFTLLPLFVTQYLDGDVLKLGWLETAMGVGIIGSGITLGVWSGFKRRVHTLFLGLIIWSVPLTIFGFTTGNMFCIGLISWGVSGLGVSMFNTLVGSLVQSTVEKDMQGRVFTLVGSMAGAAIPLALVLAGPIADVVGLRSMYFFGGGAMLLLMFVSFFSKHLMNIENHKSIDTAEKTSLPIMTKN